ncbi:DUF4129 domain-containing protein [Flagellimonas sp. 389]|uniref:DUF4129 domain-containing protein n=1 Tax=Flagellimonas sp. 389 TaxID=2835862 RepID=UPI001BD2E8F9|nr:DUF4129 domain-containing protein [Flagellimonas sp. 389]MBS9463736.1 DUF4129 domain-containing protein [Flagellimonas sp. 389]
MLKKLVLGFVLLCWGSSFSQNDSIIKYDSSEITTFEISEEDLRTHQEDESFDYEVVKVEKTWWDDIKNWLYSVLRRFFEWLFGVDEAVGYLAYFLKALPYLLLAVLLFLIMRFFIKANTRSLIYSQQNPNLVNLSEEERIIKTQDIQKLIKEALAKNDYRLAIRYYYLFILKLLSERELIEWQLQKTNDDYINELSGSTLKNAFAKATLLYDYIWYGEFTIDQHNYSKAEAVFASLKKSIATDV